MPHANPYFSTIGESNTKGEVAPILPVGTAPPAEPRIERLRRAAAEEYAAIKARQVERIKTARLFGLASAEQVWRDRPVPYYSGRGEVGRAVTPRESVRSAVTPRETTPRASTPRDSAQRAATPREVYRETTPRAVTPRESAQRAATPRESVRSAVTPRETTPRASTPRES